MKRKIGTVLLVLCCIALIGVILTELVPFAKNTVATNNATKEIEEEKDKGYAELREKYPNAVGWLEIPGTNVNYIVMYHPDDADYYLYRDPAGKYLVSGSLFVDVASTGSRNTLIHGHHQFTGTMFGKMEKYADKSYAEEHSEIIFDKFNDDGYETQHYEVVGALYTTVKESPKYLDWSYCDNDEDVMAYQEFLNNSLLYTLNDMYRYDTLMTLSTCAYQEKDGTGRFLLIARQTGIDYHEY